MIQTQILRDISPSETSMNQTRNFQIVGITQRTNGKKNILKCSCVTKQQLTSPFVNNDLTFPASGVMIGPPLAHQCGINSSLVDNSVADFSSNVLLVFFLVQTLKTPLLSVKLSLLISLPQSHIRLTNKN